MSGEGERERPRRKGKAPIISEEEQSLWRRVAGTVKPLGRAKPRVPDVEAKVGEILSRSAEKTMRPQEATSADGEGARGGPRQPSQAGQAKGGSLRPAPQPALPVPRLHRRQARRIASGAIEIDGRLDLHGLTQSAAHRRLVGFLQSAAAAGQKTVLVITGKGSGRPDPDGSDWRARDAEFGVLRRNVPRWLAEPPLRAIVVSCQPASIRHGGEGAFYVVLRRPARRG